MALGNSDRASRTYVKVYQKNEKDSEGKVVYTDKVSLWIDDDNGTDIRYSEKKSEGTITPKKGLWFEFIEGIITKVLVDDKNKFGTMLELTLVDEGKEYQLSVNVDGIYGRSLAERISGLSELGKFVKVTPYSFKARDEKTGQERELRGVLFEVDGEKQDSFFFDKVKNVSLHDYPAYPEGYVNLPDAQKKIFRAQRELFLTQFINTKFNPLNEAYAKANAPVEAPVSEATPAEGEW